MDNRANVLIHTFTLKDVTKTNFIEEICTKGYYLTNNKFMVFFNGSKGYISNIAIRCEGLQAEDNNIIWVEQLQDSYGRFLKKNVYVYWNKEKGVIIEVR